MKSPSEIIDAKGGPAKFADAIGKTAVAVRMMKHRGKLPRAIWPEITAAYPDLTTEVLIGAEQAKANNAA